MQIVRFIVTYRWELLLVGIPCVAAVAGHSVVSSWLAGAVLGVSYIRVRRLGRGLLPVVWGYVLASAIIAAAAAIVLEELRDGSLRGTWVDLLDPPWFTPWLPSWPTILAELLALLWFAHRASRLGLAHAFFLVGFMPIPVTHVAYTLLFNLGVSQLQPSHSSDLAFTFVFLTFTAVAAAAAFLRVWLLGNFDARGRAFRKGAAAVHLAVGIGLPLAGFAAFYVVAPRFYLLLVLLTVACWAAILAAAYLLRVHHPTPPSEER